MKKLFPVKFTPQSTSGESGSCGQVYSCPACLRPFNNGVKMAVLRECGHVICRSCISEFVKLSSKCYTCEKRCRPKDILPLYVEGTGFSKVGNVQAQKEAAAFQ